jgi:hypothetical protein
MVSLTVDIKKYGVDINNLDEKVTSALRKELKQQLSELNVYARKNHRFRAHTGMLEKSITTEMDGNGLVGEVGLDDSIAYYGKYVHEGHHSWAPDRFLNDALDKRAPYIEEGVKRAIEEATA